MFIFILWINALMVWWLFSVMAGIGKMATKADMNDSAVAIGTGIGFTFIIMVWALGSVVTGLLALMTRPSKR